MTIEIVIALTVVALGVGGVLGYFLKGRDKVSATRIVTLEEALAASQTELADYRQDVVQQFSDTADKFKVLDASYHALHRQLASSAVALCGDQGTPLLTAADRPALTEPEVPSEILPEHDVAVDEDKASDEACQNPVSEGSPVAEGSLFAEGSGEEIVVPETNASAATADVDASADPVPILTDTPVVPTQAETQVEQAERKISPGS
jgi:uncharacterized membrane-anchored protein YhcB (DUF1043 family)